MMRLGLFVTVLILVACSDPQPVAPHPAGKANCALCGFFGDEDYTIAEGQGAHESPEPDSLSIVFEDANLESVVRQVLDLPQGRFTPEDVSSLTRISASGKTIQSLVGLEYFADLKKLDLTDNQIVDITPLATLTEVDSLALTDNQIVDVTPLSGLTGLSWLGLASNLIEDVAPLVANTGLGEGDHVNLENNPLSTQALSEQIPALQARGVEVEYTLADEQDTDTSSDGASIFDAFNAISSQSLSIGSIETRLLTHSGRGPRWSSDGQRIVFYSSRNGRWDIYSIDSDGTNETRLTAHGSGGFSPTWSPDGSRIAFVSYRDGHDSIHIMDSDGTDETRLTENDRHDEYPRWSPDGRRIAYVSAHRENNRQNREIYVMDADGSNKTRLTQHVEDDWLPAWSPDSQRIVFLSLRNLDIEIYVMDADGSNKTRLTHRNPSYYPAWSSPDGSRIAYNSLPSFDDYGKGHIAWGANHEIYVMDADGRNKKRLTWAEGSDFWPVWSPDGERIAFVSERDGGYEIYVMDADGRNEIRLTYDAGNNANVAAALAWSPEPDSHRIVFERDRDEEIYIVKFVEIEGQ